MRLQVADRIIKDGVVVNLGGVVGDNLLLETTFLTNLIHFTPDHETLIT
jgi:hypothetical protein